MAERIAKADAERDTARKDGPTAREDAAKLSGQIEAMRQQFTELVQALGDRKPAPASDGR